MSDDLQYVGSAFLKLHEEMERISRSLTPSYVGFYEQIERVLEPIRLQHLAIARANEYSELVAARMAEIVNANQHWQTLIDQATASNRVLSDLTSAHETWVKSFRPMQDQIAQLQAATKLSLGGMAYQLTVSERVFSGLDFEAISRAVALPEAAVLRLRDTIVDVTTTYGRLAESTLTYPDVTRLPVFALGGATRELFVTGHAVDALGVCDGAVEEKDSSRIQLLTEVEAETAVCTSLLRNLDPALAKPYVGARAALREGNPDRGRHILSSLRELWNHVLRRIAPDQQVLEWIPSDKKELLHEGRPTRRARVLYVCRELNHEPLADFVDHDTRAFVKLVDVFNRIHALESELTDEQLRALVLRTDSWLTYILQIWTDSETSR